MIYLGARPSNQNGLLAKARSVFPFSDTLLAAVSLRSLVRSAYPFFFEPAGESRSILLELLCFFADLPELWDGHLEE